MTKYGALNENPDVSRFGDLFRFIRKSLIFTSTLVFAVFWLEVYLRALPNSYKEKRTGLIDREGQIETLVLGSSHAFFGINPEYLSAPAYNMAHVSQTFSLDLEVLKEFGPSLNRLKTIVLPLSLQSLYDAGEDLPAIYKNYVLYYGLPNQKSWQNSYEFHQSVNYRRILSQISNRSNSSDFVINKFGFGTDYLEASKEFSQEALTWTIKRHFGDTRDRAIVPEELKALDKILEWAALHQLRVILLATPVSDDYYSLVPAGIKGEVDSIAQFHLIDSGKAIYLDWNQHPEFDQRDFYDWDHLNSSGAKKLTLLLEDTLRLRN